MPRLASWSLVVLLIGCGRVGAFECDDDQQCLDGDAIGRCEPSGFCSFPDDACESGHRYGSAASNGLAGECVDLEPGTTSGDPSTTIGATTLDATTADPTLGETSMGTTSPVTTADDSSTAPMLDTGDCPADWKDCSFAFRRRLVPQPLANVQGGVQDFPVLLTLDATFDATHAAPDGADVRVFASDGTLLAHEIAIWSVEAAEIWIRVPSLGQVDDDDLWMYYGSFAPPPALEPRLVWSNGYIAVWHLHDEHDSTGQFDLVASNTGMAAGAIGMAHAFNGTSSRMSVDGLPDPFLDGATITAWVFADGWGTNGLGRIADMRETTPTGPGWSFHLNGTMLPTQTIRMSENHNMGQQQWSTPASSMSLGEWRWVGLSNRRTEPVDPPQLYLDGAAAETTMVENFVGEAFTPVVPFTLGALAADDDRFFDGVIDEVRIAGEIRDAAWIAYEHASAATPLLAMDDEESW